jgi:hypothetical protein
VSFVVTGLGSLGVLGGSILVLVYLRSSAFICGSVIVFLDGLGVLAAIFCLR